MFPQRKDVFEIDKNGNTLYKVFPFGKKYVINNLEDQKKLLNLEGFKVFISPYKPPVFLAIALFVSPIIVVYGFIFRLDISSAEFQQIILSIGLGLYGLICFIFYYKIISVVKKSKKNG